MSFAPENPGLSLGIESLYVQMFLGSSWAKMFCLDGHGQHIMTFDLDSPSEVRVKHADALRIRNIGIVVVVSQSIPHQLHGWVELVKTHQLYQFEMTPAWKWVRVTRQAAQAYWAELGEEESNSSTGSSSQE